MDHGKSKFITNRIKVYGIVQGVGFRPLVYHIAQKYGICGYVKNIGGYVEILAQAEEVNYQLFLSDLLNERSSGCEIVRYEVEAEEAVCAENHEAGEKNFYASGKQYQDFLIVNSESSDEISIMPPDLPVCDYCLDELVKVSDRRFLNPFISCTACGPRYTIIEELPYDRENTSMKDFTMCKSCSEEYRSPESRRHHAQTISCNECGPYLIYRELNSEARMNHQGTVQVNQKTGMDNKRSEKRVRRQLIAKQPNETESADREIDNREAYNREAFTYAVATLKAGGILAVKGIGGYHLVCSPFMEESVDNLRKLKGREEKPFAVIFETLEEVKEYCNVSEEEEKLLSTKPRPIVLLTMHKETLAPSTNKGSIYCGAFLPYTPLQQMLTKECGPLIMTSANLAGKPIIREDEEMLSMQSPYLQGILYHKRRIVRSVDDSVAKVIDHKPQLIRRSRGYVPYPVFITADGEKLSQGKKELSQGKEEQRRENLSQGKEEQRRENLSQSKDEQCRENLTQGKEEQCKEKLSQGKEEQCKENLLIGKDKQEGTSNNHLRESMIFAAGGDLKTAYCLYKNGAAVVSQYFGDTSEEAVLTEYVNSLTDLSRLLKIIPDFAVCDLHPNYHSTRFTKSLGIPVLQVQHHHAHIASVMAEHGLTGPVLGVSFDGTGYGEDGNIWGGEFLLCEKDEYKRVAHLRYVPILGGDSSMRDAKKTAACYLIASGLQEYSKDECLPVIKAALEHRVNTVLTSSMGRLFDAISSILEIGQENLYEGECAAKLEREAVNALRNQTEPAQLSFSINEKDEIIEINPKPLLEAICHLKESTLVQSLALGFHYALADMILTTCNLIRERYGITSIALSGGVFQNSILTEQTCRLLRENSFTVYYNLAVPPNDGGISLGQTYIGLLRCTRNADRKAW